MTLLAKTLGDRGGGAGLGGMGQGGRNAKGSTALEVGLGWGWSRD